MIIMLVIALATPSDNTKYEYKEDGISVDVKYPVKHTLSREHQVYFDFSHPVAFTVCFKYY